MSDSTQRLREIEEREKKASPPPWMPFKDKPQFEVAQMGSDGTLYGGSVFVVEDEKELSEQDANDIDFIVNARIDVPWLRSQLSTAEQRVRELEESMKRIHQRAYLNKGKGDPSRPHHSATCTCAWIANETAGVLSTPGKDSGEEK